MLLAPPATTRRRALSENAATGENRPAGAVPPLATGSHAARSPRAGADQKPGVREDVVAFLPPTAPCCHRRREAARSPGRTPPPPRTAPTVPRRAGSTFRHDHARSGTSQGEHVHVGEDGAITGTPTEQDQPVLAGVEDETRVPAGRRPVPETPRPPSRTAARPGPRPRAPRGRRGPTRPSPSHPRTRTGGRAQRRTPPRPRGAGRGRTRTGASIAELPGRPLAPSRTQVSPDGASQLPSHPPKTTSRLLAGS